MFVLFQPVWLLLLIPLAAAWFAWPLPNRWLKILRAVIFSSSFWRWRSSR